MTVCTVLLLSLFLVLLVQWYSVETALQGQLVINLIFTQKDNYLSQRCFLDMQCLLCYLSFRCTYFKYAIEPLVDVPIGL